MTEAVNDFLDAVLDQDFSKAQPMFDNMLGAKIADALDQEKVRVADQMFNGAEVEIEDDDPSEEEIEAAIDELDDDDEQLELDLESDEEEPEED